MNLFKKTDKDYEIFLLQKENKRLIKENTYLQQQVDAFEELRVQYKTLIDQLKTVKENYSSMMSNFKKIEEAYIEEIKKFEK